ncbi:TetR/AcrR family transcriptional regulator [Cellulomonas sp. ES6]|uniref:TetR/AcrR family transcriptional regulator n=1 Tax=Cellulomonas sp. ES6 TaxID=3039384 RepID=UPI0024B7FEBF|nr:TetR/AcrR family transcriptional regulator [Cellulomonas sp. ES6]WHP17648.1 helix-turn-helix domain-containing protein [Cellulomonas sp. ES6]
MEETRTGRARPMSREERRDAIATATIPLLVEHGSQVSTRQIALAAGVAEGTLFRAFDDKVELLRTAAERALDPQVGVREIEALPQAASLADELAQVARVVLDHGRRARRVMVGLHTLLASDEGRRAERIREARGADVTGRDAPRHAGRASGPDAEAGAFRPPVPHGRGHPAMPGRDALTRALAEEKAVVTRRLAAYAGDLRVEPERLAGVLLAAVMGHGFPFLPEDADAMVADLVEVLLHGAART